MKPSAAFNQFLKELDDRDRYQEQQIFDLQTELAEVKLQLAASRSNYEQLTTDHNEALRELERLQNFVSNY